MIQPLHHAFKCFLFVAEMKFENWHSQCCQNVVNTFMLSTSIIYYLCTTFKDRVPYFSYFIKHTLKPAMVAEGSNVLDDSSQMLCSMH